MVPPFACRPLPFTACTVIGPGLGPANASSVSVPPVTLVAFVVPLVAIFVLPTTVVTPEVTLTVVVIGGGLGPTVCDLAVHGWSITAANITLGIKPRTAGLAA